MIEALEQLASVVSLHDATIAALSTFVSAILTSLLPAANRFIEARQRRFRLVETAIRLMEDDIHSDKPKKVINFMSLATEHALQAARQGGFTADDASWAAERAVRLFSPKIADKTAPSVSVND